MHPVAELINKAQKIVLSTHTQPDGDGLGAQIAMYWALKKIGKSPRIINVDATPKKYNFLDTHGVIETLDKLKAPFENFDLGLIFDTNDQDLLLGLWPQLVKNCKQVSFVDHHPLLERRPLNPDQNIIDINASSTGEVVFNLIKTLQIPFDSLIAQPIYSSIVFDTNYFRYIRGSPTSHLIAAELLRHNIDPQLVHRRLFGNQTPNKLKFLAQVLGQIEYEFEGRLACIRVKKSEMEALQLELDETRDIIDMVMNVESVEAAVLFREEKDNSFKLSFRSKGLFQVSQMAQDMGGGGHSMASGAYIQASYKEIKVRVLSEFTKLFAGVKTAASG